MTETLELSALADRLPDGASVAVAKPPFTPMALARALIARRARDLTLVTVPTSDLFADALIGAGCLGAVETSGVTLGEFGPAPFFARAVREGRLTLRDATCPAIYAALQAGEKGVPFMPMRGILGSDLLPARPDWKTIQNPFAEDEDPLVLLPALRPDFAVMHVAEADRHGNLWVGGQHHLKTMAHAAHATLATAERIVDGDLREDPNRSANLVAPIYVEAVAEAPGGAWPQAAPPLYEVDASAMRAYAAAARAACKGEAGDDWLSVLTPPAARAAE